MKPEPIPYRPSYRLKSLKYAEEQFEARCTFPPEYKDRYERLSQFKDKYGIIEIDTYFNDGLVFDYFRVLTKQELDFMVIAMIKREVHPLPVRFEIRCL